MNGKEVGQVGVALAVYGDMRDEPGVIWTQANQQPGGGSCNGSSG